MNATKISLTKEPTPSDPFDPLDGDVAGFNLNDEARVLARGSACEIKLVRARFKDGKRHRVVVKTTEATSFPSSFAHGLNDADKCRFQAELIEGPTLPHDDVLPPAKAQGCTDGQGNTVPETPDLPRPRATKATTVLDEDDEDDHRAQAASHENSARLDDEPWRNDPAVRNAIRECVIMSMVDHPNVLSIYRAEVADGAVHAVLEYAKHGDLHRLIARHGRLDENSAALMTWQLTCAVYACHAAGIAHRDIKPENVLLGPNANVRLADFGLAALVDDPVESAARPSRGGRFDSLSDRCALWSTNTPCGTPQFAAPEVYLGSDCGCEVDLWGIGITLYTMLSGGKYPWQREGESASAVPVAEIARRVTAGEVSRLPEEVSEEARGLVESLLTVDPAERATLADVVDHPWFASRIFDAGIASQDTLDSATGCPSACANSTRTVDRKDRPARARRQ